MRRVFFTQISIDLTPLICTDLKQKPLHEAHEGKTRKITKKFFSLFATNLHQLNIFTARAQKLLFFLVKTLNPKFIVVLLRQYCFYNDDCVLQRKDN